MDVISQYQDIVAAIVGVALGAAVSVIGWSVNRLYKMDDDLDRRVNKLEHEQITKEDCQQLETRIEAVISRTCVDIRGVDERLNARFDSLMQHLMENRRNAGR